MAQLHIHPGADAAILVLAEDVTSRVPSLQPIPFNRSTPVGTSRPVQAGGYGQTHDGSEGRYFATVFG